MDSQARALLGPNFAGLETRFANVRSLLDYYAASRSATSLGNIGAQRLRHMLLTADVDTVDAFMVKACSPLFDALAEYISTTGTWENLGDDLAKCVRQRELLGRLVVLASNHRVPSGFSIRQTFEAVAAAASSRDLVLKINGDGAAKGLLDDCFAGVQTDVEALRLAIDYVDRLSEGKASVPEVVLERLAALDRGGLRSALGELMPLWLRAEQTIVGVCERLQGSHLLDVDSFFGAGNLKTLTLTSLLERVGLVLGHAEVLDDWVRYLGLRAFGLEVAGKAVLGYYETIGFQRDTPLAKVFSSSSSGAS